MQAVGREEKLESIYFEIAAKFPPWEGAEKTGRQSSGRKKRGIPGFFRGLAGSFLAGAGQKKGRKIFCARAALVLYS